MFPLSFPILVMLFFFHFFLFSLDKSLTLFKVFSTKLLLVALNLFSTLYVINLHSKFYYIFSYACFRFILLFFFQCLMVEGQNINFRFSSLIQAFTTINIHLKATLSEFFFNLCFFFQFEIAHKALTN